MEPLYTIRAGHYNAIVGLISQEGQTVYNMVNRIDLLDENRRPGSIVWRLAWPIMLEQVLIMLVQYVDTAMVGALGPNATAAVALTSPTSWLVQGLLVGVAIGFGVPVGNYVGAGRMEEAKAVVRQSVIAIFFFGLLMTAAMELVAPILPHWLGGDPAICDDATSYISIVGLSYICSASVQICSNLLRCTGDTSTPLIFNVSTNVINMVLNFLLIYPTREINVLGWRFTMWGADLGVSGAAIATAVATLFSGAMLLRALFSSKFRCQIKLKESYRFQKEIWKDMLRVGSPVTFERMCISTGQIFMTAMVTSLGTASLAAHSLGTTAESITYMPAFGFSAAATTLVAQSMGAQRRDLASNYSKFCISRCVLFMTLMGVVLYFGGGWLISLFTPSEEVVRIGAAALRIEALAQPFFALSICISGVLRGARKTKWPFLFALLGMWCVRLPLCFFLTKYTSLGLTGAWVGMAADLTVRGLASLLLYRGGRWLGPVDAPAAPAQGATPAS